MTLLLVLTAVGGLLQVGGILLAAAEVRARRDAVRAYHDRPLPPAAGYLAEHWTRWGSGAATAGGPPTLEGRLAALEQRAEAQGKVLAELESRSHRAAIEVAQGVAGIVELRVQHQVDGVRQLLLDVTGGGARAYTSLGAVLTGVALQTLAGSLALMTAA